MTASAVRYLLQMGTLAAVYFAAAKGGLLLATVGAQVTLVWPPTGLALAALLLGGPRLWPGVALGATLVNASTGVPPATACGMGMGNTLEAVTAVAMLRRFGFQASLDRLRDVLALVALAAGLSTIASATVGVASLLLGGVLPRRSVATAWGTWWLGDALGDLVVAPLLLTVAVRPWRDLKARRAAEAAILLVAVVLASFAVFGGWFGMRGTYLSLVYLIFPFALWATLRFGPPGAVLFTSVVSSFATWGVVHVTGPFVHGTILRYNLLNTQVFMGVAAVTVLILAAAVAERERAAAGLRALQSITDTALAHLALTDLLPQVLDRVTTALVVDNTAILLIDDDGQTLVVYMARGPADQMAGQRRIPRGLGIAGQIAASRQPLVVDDLSTVETGEAITPFWRETMHASMGVPIVMDDRVIGVLLAGTRAPRHFMGDEVRLLQLVADRIALAIDHAHLYEAERRAHAEAASAVQARDGFLSVAAHELKTPLTSLRGFAQLLLYVIKGESRIDAPAVRRALQHIDQQSIKLEGLVTHLLDLSRIEAGKLALDRQATDVTELVKAMAAAAQAETRLHMLVVDAPGPIVANIDPLRVEQVLVNIVNNAIKYSPDGGPIEITVRPCIDAVQVTVRDHGLGIAPEHQAHIFDRFYQAHAHSHHSGMGLGLHISRQIVDLHGGSITAAFPTDGGSAFVITLPRGHANRPTRDT
jgi:K+-sensing histidine kinase KdpD